MNKLLIIDDDVSMTQLLSVVLKSDYKIVAQHTLEAAKDEIRTTSLSGIILDLNLSGDSGLDIISFVRKEVSKWLPILVLSGKEKSEDRIKCFQEGADDYLMKPFNPVELKMRLNRNVEKYKLLTN